MKNKKQVFVRGDVVRVAAKLPKSMDHFGHEGEEGIVFGSYADQYGAYGDAHKEYTVAFKYKHKGKVYWGKSSWWPEDVLSKVRARSLATLDKLDGVEE